MVTKTKKPGVHAPIVMEDGTVIEKVWRIKHIPSGMYFKPGRGFMTTEGRLAKTYSRKPSLGIIGSEFDYQGKPNLIHIGGVATFHEVPRSEIKVVEYIITESGKVYDK